MWKRKTNTRTTAKQVMTTAWHLKGKLKKATIKQEKQKQNQAKSKLYNRNLQEPQIKRSKANRVHMLLPPHCFQIRRRLLKHWSYLVLPLISEWSWQEQGTMVPRSCCWEQATPVVDFDITESFKVQKGMEWVSVSWLDCWTANNVVAVSFTTSIKCHCMVIVLCG